MATETEESQSSIRIPPDLREQLEPLVKRIESQVSVDDLPGVSFYESAGFTGQVCDDIYGPKPVGLYAVPHGVVFGAVGVLFSSSMEILREQNYGSLSKEELLRHVYVTATEAPNPNSQIHVSHAISLLSPCCYCFWHWMMDCLPKVIVAEAAGYTGSYLVPPPVMTPWVETSMMLLGIPECRLVEHRANITVTDVLYVPTYFSGFQAHTCLSIVGALRVRMRQALREYPLTGVPERIFVARKPMVRTRKIVNLEEARELMSRFGFATLFFEDYELIDQLRIAFNAKMLVTPHGSGMTHAFFMPQESVVVELFPFERRDSCGCYAKLMPVAGHRYLSLESEEDRASDIEVPCKSLQTILEEVAR